MGKREIVTGVLVATAVTGIALSKAWLNRSLEERNSTDFTVTFDDAKGLKGGEEVRVAGFQVGSVKEIKLDPSGRKAVVRLRVSASAHIPADSKLLVSSGLLGSTPFITVVPGQSTEKITEGLQLEGDSSGGLDGVINGASRFANDPQIQEDLKTTLHNVRVSTDQLASMLDDPQSKGDLKATLRNVRVASEQLPKTIAQIQQVTNNAAVLSESMKNLGPMMETEVQSLAKQTKGLMTNLDDLTRSGNRIALEAEGVTKDLHATLNENRGGLKALLRSANDTASGAAALTQQLAGTIGDPTLKKNLVAATTNLVTVSDSFTKIAAKLDVTVGELSKTATDPELLGNVKATVANLKDTSASIKDLAANVTGRVTRLRLPGEPRTAPSTTGPTRSTPTPPSPARPSAFWYEPGLTGDFLYDTKAERFRLDTQYALVSGDRLYRLGLFDATERNRVSAQYGQKSGAVWTRYGLFAGKLGAGFDTTLGGLDFRLDLYDPNRFTTNARVRARLNENTALTLGIDGVGKTNHPTIGVQLRK